MHYSLKTILLLLFFSAALAASATDKPNRIKTGAFGVCGCKSQNNTPQMIELLLLDDHTFSYTDNSNPKRPLKLAGTWVAKGNTVRLVSANKGRSFHRKWKFNDNGTCITSRYMLNFRRICLMDQC